MASITTLMAACQLETVPACSVGQLAAARL